MSALRLRLGYPRRGARRAGLMLAGTALFLAGLAGAAPAHGAGDVIARLGPLTISATALRPGTAGTLTTYMQVSTSGQPSDQLDAAIARTAPRRPRSPATPATPANQWPGPGTSR